MSKILIVDDEKVIRQTLRDILEYEDYEIDEAENGPAVEGIEDVYVFGQAGHVDGGRTCLQ